MKNGLLKFSEMIGRWAIKEVVEEKLVTLDKFGISLNVDINVASVEKDNRSILTNRVMFHSQKKKRDMIFYCMYGKKIYENIEELL